MNENTKKKSDKEKKRLSEELNDIKDCINDSDNYFKDNVKRFRDFREFVFKSTLTEAQRGALRKLKRPISEFNILEAFISRLRGEFANQQPGLKIQAVDGLPDFMLDEEFIQLINVLEAHMQAILLDSDKDKLEYDVFTDTLSGGFSVMKVFTEYVNENSFEQLIQLDRPFSVTACGFDPIAKKSHKGDGSYCYEIFPMLKDDFESKYGTKLTESMKFAKVSNAFSWSYTSQGKDIVVLCDFWKKKKRRVKLIKLVNGLTTTEEEYNKEKKRREKEYNPVRMVEKSDEWRWTEITEIWRYRCCESEIIEERKTNYKYLPLVFVDGNSIDLETEDEIKQMTRPYVYNAKGIQDQKNAAGQSISNEIENLAQHQLIMAEESVPTKNVGALTNPQKSPVITYKYFYDNNPDIPLPAPVPVPRQNIPAILTETFRLSDEMTQMILGSYDSSQGVNNNNLSGKAIATGAMQSNIASVPYIMGYLKGLNRVAQIILDLIPKYYRTPRTLPILKPDGTRDYYTVNKKDTVFVKDYEPSHLQVKVTAGINFAMQKHVALETLQMLIQSSKEIAEFISEKGMHALLDNVEIRGIEDLKLKAKEWQKEKEETKKAQMQMQQQAAQMEMAKLQKELQEPSKGEIEAQKLQVTQEKNQAETMIKTADMEIKKEEVDLMYIKELNDQRGKEIDNLIEAARIDAENTRTSAQLALDASKHEHDKMLANKNVSKDSATDEQ